MVHAVQDKMRNALLRHLLSIAVFVLIVAPAAHARTLTMTLDGQETLVDVTAPTANGAFRGTVILVHGFMRTRETMAGHAVTLARDGYWVVVPDLPYVMDSRDNAVALRDLIRQLQHGAAGEPLDSFVLVGFSAGGLSALLAADMPGVAGYVGLDPFDRPGGVGLEAARKLAIPAFLLRGPSAGCNAYSIAEPWVQGAAEPDRRSTVRGGQPLRLRGTNGSPVHVRVRRHESAEPGGGQRIPAQVGPARVVVPFTGGQCRAASAGRDPRDDRRGRARAMNRWRSRRRR